MSEIENCSRIASITDEENNRNLKVDVSDDGVTDIWIGTIEGDDGHAITFGRPQLEWLARWFAQTESSISPPVKGGN